LTLFFSVMNTVAELSTKFLAIWPMLDERRRRLMAAIEAKSLGYGGVSLVSRACGLSRNTILKGIRGIEAGTSLEGRIRRPGAGHKPISVSDPTLEEELEAILEETTRGDPQSALRWTLKSTRKLAETLSRIGHPVGHSKVGQILHDMDYSLQGNRKTEEGDDNPDRDAQFRHINNAVKRNLARGWPLISVDTKRNELLGNYHNAGQQWRPSKQPRKLLGHDFPSPEVPRSYLYGIYDIGQNTGFVNVGTDHDTGEFAVASIRGWWRHEGKHLYPRADTLLITADSGGSNDWRLRLWKVELQKFADGSGLSLSVCHFPPGTSKWNKIEHRLFSFITSNWRGEPLMDYETIVNLIAGTTTTKGLKVPCRLDRRKYRTGRKVTKDEMKQLYLNPDKFHGEWTYRASISRTLGVIGITSWTNARDWPNFRDMAARNMPSGECQCHFVHASEHTTFIENYSTWRT
jgi:transposase